MELTKEVCFHPLQHFFEMSTGGRTITNQRFAMDFGVVAEEEQKILALIENFGVEWVANRTTKCLRNQGRTKDEGGSTAN